jgi:two-component system response regulator WspF
LSALLLGLPHGVPAAIVIVQHVDERFAQGMADWLNRHSNLPVRLAREGDVLAPGMVLLAGTSNHLVIAPGRRVQYAVEPLDEIYRPSINVLFKSISSAWAGSAIGVLLTGMGSDGARGLKVLRDQGHHTIAQNSETSAVFGMPKAAAAMSAAVDILPLEEIAPALINLVSGKKG